MAIKLPDDKQERIKIFVLIGIFATAISYVGATFLLGPYFKAGREKRARIAELDDLLWRAEKDINSIRGNLRRNTVTVSNILAISESQRYILRPSLGNYLLVASEEIEKAANAAGVTIDNIRDTSGPPPKVTDGESKNINHSRFWSFAVDISLQADIFDTINFLDQLLKRNPYIAVYKLAIIPRDDASPLKHMINIGIQWPVWRDNDHPNKLAAEQLADEEQQ